ncbi:unnamed protein product, partial [Schistosoma rodhaini]
MGICGDCSIFTVEITSRFKLDYHWKSGSTGRPSRPSIGLLGSAHPRFRMRDPNLGPSVLRAN